MDEVVALGKRGKRLFERGVERLCAQAAAHKNQRGQFRRRKFEKCLRLGFGGMQRFFAHGGGGPHAVPAFNFL